LVQRLGGRGHLAQVEEDGDQGSGLDGVAVQSLELVGEVRDRRAATQPDRLAVALGDVDAADDRRRPHLEFLPLRPPRLALLALAAALAEGTCGAAAGSTTTAAATGTTGEAAATAGTLESAACSCTGTGTAGTAGALLERSATGTTAGTTASATGTTGTRSADARRVRTRSLRARNVTGGGTLSHALRRSERVVSGTGARRTLPHALRRSEGAVARTRPTG